MTVGEAAALSPAAARVFEADGIDFCCAGQISITEACLARNLDPTAVLLELESALEPKPRGGVDWQYASTADLIEYIVERHHAYLKAALPRIQALAEELSGEQTHDFADRLHALIRCFRGLKEELEARLMQQETVLFPALRNLDRASPPGAEGVEHHSISRMMEGNDSVAKSLSEIRRLASHYRLPEGASSGCRELYDALSALEADLHRHFHLENNVLFRRATEPAKAAESVGGPLHL